MRLSLLLSLLVSGTSLVIADERSFIGRIFAVPSEVPAPEVFFPLTDGGNETTLASWPSSNYDGNLTSMTSTPQTWWTADDVFGTVLTCNKSSGDYASLSPVPYGIVGPFTIAFWFKPDVSQMGGVDFQYLFSHSEYGLENPNSAFATNSVNIYLPEAEHPAYGLVRTVVKDENDNSTTSFLDSDGTYDNNENRTDSNAERVTDGDWHFVTLTTRIDGRKGYMLYIDGSLKAQLPLPGADAADFNVSLDGGDAMNLLGDIVLCSRDALNDDRHYSGKLAHLSLFSLPLMPSQVLALYQAVPTSSQASSPAAGPVTSSWLDQFAYNSSLQVANGEVVTCLTNVSTAGSCETGYICAPLTEDQLTALNNSQAGLPLGVCTLAGINDFPVSLVTTPYAYFPLTNYSTASWPLAEHSFFNSSQANPVSWAYDDTFGEVISCDGNSSLSVDLGTSWGSTGSFGFTLWMKQESDPGDLFQYLISTRSNDTGYNISDLADVYQPNEVHIYLPENSHPANNLVRAIVKDSNDNYTASRDGVFLDSDGQVGSNLPRSTPRLDLTDGSWHQVAVTTQSPGSKGFSIYVDGLFMAQITEPQDFFSVPGGDPLSANGNIVLCGRSDLAENRFFNGKLAQFAIFDGSLSPQAVRTLYSQIYQDPPSSSINASLAIISSALPPGVSTSRQNPSAGAPVFSVPRLGDSGIGLQDPEDPEVAQAVKSVDAQGASQPSGLSHGQVAGIVVGVLAGVALVAAASAFAILRTRRRRMHGVVRLQEVPLGMQPSHNEDKFIAGINAKPTLPEDKFVAGINAKLHEGQQQPIDL